ncbi:MAG: cyclopropane fatty acyl phospholipid synthase [bacterium]|nr:cyclopropane fatty acyl phospholipid synthase [bacterium]
MASKSIEQTVRDLARRADIKIDGPRPWDMQVHNKDLYKRILAGGSLGLGEAYMEGWWDCQALDQFFDRVLRLRLETKIGISPGLVWNAIKARVLNQQSKSKAHVIGERHYDIGNDLYTRMLDSRMNYSCGYWNDAETLEQAQVAKLDLICKKLQLKPGLTLLDIGCGWGSLAKFAAQNYQVKVVGITISKEQASLARDRCAGLDIEIRLQDYRSLTEQFDRIASVGMVEHVGYKNYREFMEVSERTLKRDGLFLLHTIGGNTSVKNTDPWIDKYIFPNSMLPSALQLTRAAEGLFCLRDWHNFGTDYDKTLMAWQARFNQSWPEMQNKYDERFRRMWNYYLLSCAGSFRSHKNQLWQIVFTKVGAPVDYKSIR